MGDRYQYLFDSLTEEVVVIDRDLRISYANPAWLRRVGLLPTQVQGQTCHQVLLGASEPCLIETCTVQQVFRTGQPRRGACEGYRRQADRRAFEVSASPVLDAKGSVTEVIHILLPSPVDVLLEPEGEGHAATERRLREIADALHEAVLSVRSGQGLETVLSLILDQLRRVVDYDSASIMLMRDGGAQIIASQGFPPDLDADQFVLPPSHEKFTWMQRTRQPMLIHDVQADPSWLPIAGSEYIRSWIGAPLFAQERMIGILNLDKAEPNHYQPDDARLVMAFGSQAAAAIENARLLESEHRRSVQLSLLRDISQHVLSILDVEALLEYAVVAIQQQFGYYYVDVFLTDPEDKYLIFQASSHPEYASHWRKQDMRFRIGKEGITGRVAATGQAYLANDVEQDAHYLPDELLTETRSELAVPIMVGERVIGVLDLNSDQLNAFDEDDLFVAQSLADQLALGLENARLFAAERQRRQELQSIQATATALSAELHLDTLLHRIVTEAAQAFGAEATSLMLWDEDEAFLLVRASHGLSDEYVRRQRIPRQQALAAILADGSAPPIYLPELVEAPFGDVELIREEGLRSALTIPMIMHGHPTGALNIYSKGRSRVFVPSEVELAEAFAAQAAAMIANAQLYQRAEGYAEQLADRARRLALVNRISIAVNSTLDLDQILDTAAREMARAFDIKQCGIVILDRDAGYGTVAAEYQAVPDHTATAVRIPLDDNASLERVIATQQPLAIADARHDPMVANIRDVIEARNIHSILLVPLIVKEQVIGTIGLDAIEAPRTFTADEIDLALTIANQVGLAVENARLYQGMQQRLTELSLLFDTSAAVSTSLDPDRVVQTTAEKITQALAASGCALSTWDRERNVLTTLLDYSPDSESWNAEPPGTVYDLADFPATMRVLTNRQPHVAHASRPDTDPADVAWMVDQDVRSLLMVPMVVRDEVIGLLELMESSQEREFTATEINLCQTLANQAAAALENARLFQEAQTRAREMTALAAVGKAVTTLDLDEVLRSTAENALQAVQAEISSVYLLDAEEKQLIPCSVLGLRCDELELASFALGEGTIGQVAQSGTALIVHDTATDPAFIPKTEAAQQIHNTLTVPLAVKGTVIGTLEVCNKIGTRGFTADDERLLTTFAGQAAVAIENARLYQQVSHHLEEVQFFNRVARAATSSLDLDQIIRRSLSALLGMRNIERVHILLVDEARGDLWLHPALTDSEIFPQRADFRVPMGQGITGWVAQTGTAVRVADVRQDPRYLAGYTDTLSELCVPLRVGERIIGVLDVQSTRLDAFSEDEERLLTTLAGQLSTIIDNVRLFNETEQRVRELTALTQASMALNEAENLDTVLNIVLEQALGLLDSKEGSIILIDPPESNTLRIVAERGLGPAVVEDFNQRPVYTHEGTYKRAISSRRMIEVADTSIDPDFLHDVGSRALTVTNVPLVTERGVIGLIAAEGLPGDDTTRRLLTALADMAAVAIDKERLHQETADRLAEVSTLYTLSTQMTSSLALRPVLESIVHILKLTLDCRACSIFLLDPTGESLTLQAGSGPSEAWKGVARLKVGSGVSGRVIEEQRSIYVPDTQVESGFIYFDPNIRSLLVVPLIARDKVIGTLSIDDTRANAFDKEVRFLTIAAAQAAAAIDSAQLYESLQNSYSELEQAYDELQHLDRMKSEFVQNISHELRTPLTFIKGYVELLMDEELGVLNEEQRAAMEIVENKARTLSRLVDDIISLQQAEREGRPFEAVSLADVGRAAVRSAKASAAELDIRLHDEIPEGMPMVLGDGQRLGQVFDNLLQNALKFSNPGDQVIVRMRKEGAFLRTEVEDSGIGIPADQLSRIFDRFYQVDGTTKRRFGGTGLGLAIVQQIVENHGGQVGVESVLGEGSTFYFTIPWVTSD